MSKATRRFIINKLGELVISLLIVTILSFLLVRLSPIDPAEAYARCRGLSEGKILFRYALPSAVVTLLPNFCQMLGLCMAGSAIVERVFSLPGLGYLIIDSVLYRDSPVIHATILFLAFSLVMFNILSDILRRILQRDASAREGARL